MLHDREQRGISELAPLLGVLPHASADVPGIEDQAAWRLGTGNVIGARFANAPPGTIFSVNRSLRESLEPRLSHQPLRLHAPACPDLLYARQSRATTCE